VWENRGVNRDDKVLDLFRRAAADRERGASEIEEGLVRGLLALNTRLDSGALVSGARLLAEGQPAMANLRSLAARAAAPAFRRFLEQRARALDELPHRLAANAWPHIEGASTVVTISRSRTVAAVVEGARERGWRGSVAVVARTATASSCLDASAVVVLVGADAVGPRRFVNAAGTTMLMELAAARGVERVLAADSGKDVSEDILDDIVGSLQAPDQEWPVFEAIPMSLVSERVTE
jgi:translation initiation factor 2B subunit (eIF-2B alpha/beta/delta family)